MLQSKFCIRGRQDGGGSEESLESWIVPKTSVKNSACAKILSRGRANDGYRLVDITTASLEVVKHCAMHFCSRHKHFEVNRCFKLLKGLFAVQPLLNFHCSSAPDTTWLKKRQ